MEQSTKARANGRLGSSSSQSKIGAPAAKNTSAENLDLNDCTCAICLDVLIEPLLTPCNHEMCLECFRSIKEDIRKFSCPMCRALCGEWAVKVTLGGKSHVNTKRWEAIKVAFMDEVNNKLTGRSSQLVIEAMQNYKRDLLEGKVEPTTSRGGDFQVAGAEGGHVIAKPGELRQEYLEFLRQEKERIQREKEKEEQESMALINRLLQEDQVAVDYNIRLNYNRPIQEPARISVPIDQPEVLNRPAVTEPEIRPIQQEPEAQAQAPEDPPVLSNRDLQSTEVIVLGSQSESSAKEEPSRTKHVRRVKRDPIAPIENDPIAPSTSSALSNDQPAQAAETLNSVSQAKPPSALSRRTTKRKINADTIEVNNELCSLEVENERRTSKRRTKPVIRT